MLMRIQTLVICHKPNRCSRFDLLVAKHESEMKNHQIHQDLSSGDHDTDIELWHCGVFEVKQDRQV